MEHFDKYIFYVDHRRRTAAIEEVIAYAEKDLDCGGCEVEYHVCHCGLWISVAADDALVVNRTDLPWAIERLAEEYLIYRQSKRRAHDWETFLVAARLLL